MTPPTQQVLSTPPAIESLSPYLASSTATSFSASSPLHHYSLLSKLIRSLFFQRFLIFSACLIGSFTLAALPIKNAHDEKKPAFTLSVTFVMCVLWVTQSIPLAATSLIPIFAFPFLGIMSGSETSSAYVNHISMIFIGGFIVALAMERWNLHKRIALFVITKTLGGKKKKKTRRINETSTHERKKYKRSTIYRRLPLLLFGFAFTAWIFSQWVSNTATALVFVPNALAIVDRLEVLFGKKAVAPLSASLFLSIAAGCNIGGLATIIGTPSNLIFLNSYAKLVPDAKEISFMQWFLFGFPLAAVNAVFMYVYMMLVYTSRSMFRIRSIIHGSANHISKSGLPSEGNIQKSPSMDSIRTTDSHERLTGINVSILDTLEEGDAATSMVQAICDTQKLSYIRADADENDDPHSLQTFHDDYKRMGWISYEELVVLCAFIVMGILWASRSGIYFIPGWGALFPSGFMNDGTVAILVGFALFCIPAWHTPPGEESHTKSGNKRHYSIMDWNTMKGLPWDIILLFGGGFALAEAFTKSELDVIIGRQLFLFAEWPVFLLIFMVCSLVCLMTCVVSNVATTTIFLPIVYAVSKSANVHPLMLMIPATISSSFSFLLPISTGPNMIAFSSHRITMLNFVTSGFAMTVVGVLSSTVFCYVFIPLIFGVPIYLPEVEG